jgi:hypothetical protein
MHVVVLLKHRIFLSFQEKPLFCCEDIVDRNRERSPPVIRASGGPKQFVYSMSRIFTSVPLSNILEKAPPSKKQKQPLCRISDSRKECVDEDVFGASRFTGSTHPQVVVEMATSVPDFARKRRIFRLLFKRNGLIIQERRENEMLLALMERRISYSHRL